ncbi:beta-microseminoprotein-like [Athene cunicularia]|uniref:beta-microseminoprotein-like n=1 Tax=Athene cunicularia TaxID=194338 RepID=UPI000EF6F2C5|nr:beta-microseminoprotein-like [Athene cunicularia]
MKTILACLLVLAVTLPLSNASCFIELLNSENSNTEGCFDSKKELHKFGSKWRTEDCLDCHCSKDGIDCCTAFARPVGYDEEKCVNIFNKETCTYKTVEKDDHSKECPVHEWVG